MGDDLLLRRPLMVVAGVEHAGLLERLADAFTHRMYLWLVDLEGQAKARAFLATPEREIDLLDTYLLIVSDGRVVIRPSANLFTWPKYTTWLRLPANAGWFVVHARNTELADSVTREDFADKAAAFDDDIAGLRARELSLTEGVYTNDLFIPPWSTWQIPDGDLTRVPVNEDQAHLFQWPDIRYFTYSGALGDVEEIIADHCVDEVAIVAYTASGDVLDVCQR